MSCPTCDHTLQGVGETTDGRRHFWCPRCGTLRSVAGNHADTEAPRIADLARAIIAEMDSYTPDVDSLPDVRALREAATGRPDR